MTATIYTRQTLKKPNCTISSAFIPIGNQFFRSYCLLLQSEKRFEASAFIDDSETAVDLWLNRLDVGQTSEGRRFKDIRLVRARTCSYVRICYRQSWIFVGYYPSILRTFVNSVLPRIMQRYFIYEIRSFELRYFTSSRRIKLIYSRVKVHIRISVHT